MIMLRAFSALFLAVSIHASCEVGPHGDPAKATDVDNFHQTCVLALRQQVRVEFQAALQYLLMGAYFGQDNVDLPGFSKMFFDHADEEREHGLKFIDYLRHRGDTDNAFFDDIAPILNKNEWNGGPAEALRDALTMEKIVTGKIKKLVDSCDNDNGQDYLTADWLTGTWLDEQLDGQRHLAGLINTLDSFRRDHNELGDWMFDQQMQKDLAA